jgi:transposase
MQIYRDLTDAQWHSVEGLFHALRARKDPRGRPSHPARALLNGVLWILTTRSAWAELPNTYPDYRTCHRHFKGWYESGVLRIVLQTLYYDAGIEMYETMTQRMQSRHARPRLAVSLTTATSLAPPAASETPPPDLDVSFQRTRSAEGA